MSKPYSQPSEALGRSEERYRVLFDMSPVAVYSIDSSGIIREFNRVAAELWGREPALGDTDERFCGSFKLFRPDGSYMPHEQCPMAQVVTGEIQEARDAEVIIERPDGSRVTVIVNIRPLKGPDGSITGAINCFYDITERHRMERERQLQTEALADLNRRKDEFLAMLSHELRNPLAPIVNAVHMLRSEPNDDLQLRSRTILERQVTQLTRLVDDLMDVARISTGRVRLQLDDVPMSAVVKRAVDATGHLVDQRQHELTVSLASQPIQVRADGARLEQILVNLLTNAAKYTEPGGNIWLSVVQEGSDCVVRVRDTGIGIAPDVLPRVFDLFTQGERSLARSQGGLGVGLALVKRLVEMHGGHIEAHSSLGQGSEFIVTLPVAAPSAASATEDQPDSSAGVDTGPLRILVVDDNADTVDSLEMVLKQWGHDVRKAHDGSSVLDVAMEYRPHVMFLDIGLPGLDGYQLAARVRGQSALQNAVLVALTGYGDAAARQRAVGVGFDHYLTKPADLGRLKEILATCSP